MSGSNCVGQEGIPHKRLVEYDGAYECVACKKQWGALPGNPLMPRECNGGAMSEPDETCGCFTIEDGVIDRSVCRIRAVEAERDALKAAHDEAVRKIQEELSHLERVDKLAGSSPGRIGWMNALRFALSALGVKEEE